MGATAVLLMAHGAVDSPEDVRPYLEGIFKGRPVSEELVREIQERYQAIGGKSPLLDITKRQAKGLEEALRASGSKESFKVYVGMRNWKPWIRDAVRRIKADQPDRLAAVCLTPYASSFSTGLYFEHLEREMKDLKYAPELVKIPSWNEHPLLIQAFTEKVASAWKRLPDGGRGAEAVFSAHSLPSRVLQNGDPYPHQFRSTAEKVAVSAGIGQFRLAYQSRSPSQEPWLGPDVQEVLELLSRQGAKNVLLAPIGFISDHMETLYDDDILYRKIAESKGLRFERATSLNDSPLLAQALASVVLGNLSI